MTSPALYYPRISLPSENWLKSSLLLFPGLRRIIPHDYDDKLKYTKAYEEAELLGPADLYAYETYKAQERFLHTLRNHLRDNPAISDKLSYDRIRGTRNISTVGVHVGKMGEQLGRYLRREGLTDPDTDGFLPLHPALAEAIMSTLAISAATANGSPIITENGQLHTWLQSLDPDEAFEALLNDDYVVETGSLQRPGAARAEDAVALMVFADADLSKVTPTRLKALNEDREAIEALRNELARLGRQVPTMTDPDANLAALRDTASDALKKWEQDRNNMSNFWKTFFGTDLTKASGGFLGRIGEMAAAGLSAGAGLNALVGSKPIGAAAGFGIALVTHSVLSWKSARRARKNSPYRFLTACRENGVIFSPQ